MKEVLEKRQELIDRYNEITRRENFLVGQAVKGLRNQDLMYEVDKEQLIYAKNEVLVSLVQSELPVMNSIIEMYAKVLEENKRKLKENPNNQKLINKHEDDNVRYREFCKIKETLQDIIKIVDDDFYEIGLAMKELNKTLNTGSEDMINEALANVRIMRNLFKVCCIEGENETFDMMQSTYNKLSLEVESYQDDELDK